MISIIVPVYNVAQYLPECIDSILAQTFRDFELILVDDGSTDESGRICDEYADKDERIQVIHQKNEGLSGARNRGINKAKGKYIFFLDSDDWLNNTALEVLYTAICLHKCDIVQGGLYYAYSGYLLLDERKYKCSFPTFVLDREQAMYELIKNDYVKSFACGKLYKAEIVKRHKFLVGKFFEDCYWQHLIFHEINKLCIVPKPCYYYRQRESGISWNFSERSLDLLKGYETRLDFITNYYPKYRKLMTCKYKCLAKEQMDMALKSKNKELIISYKHYLETHNVSYNYWLYQIYKLYKRIVNYIFTKNFTKINYPNEGSNLDNTLCT